MPTGPLGTPRPFASCELIYQARYNIDRGIGVTLENDDIKRNAEKLIAQRVEDEVDFRNVSVKISPAGWAVLIEIGLADQEIVASGNRTQGLAELRGTVDNGVEANIDENAERGEAIDAPEWSIRCA